MRAMRRPIATDAYSIDTMNVIDMEAIIPTSAVNDEKYLNVGLNKY